MSTAQRLNTYLKMLAAGATVAAGLTVTPSTAQAQVNLKEGGLIFSTWENYYHTWNDEGYIWYWETPGVGAPVRIRDTDYGVTDMVWGNDGYLYYTTRDSSNNGAQELGTFERWNPANNDSSQFWNHNNQNAWTGGNAIAKDHDGKIIFGTQEYYNNSWPHNVTGYMWKFDPSNNNLNVMRDFTRFGGSNSNNYGLGAILPDRNNPGEYFVGINGHWGEGYGNEYSAFVKYNQNTGRITNTFARWDASNGWGGDDTAGSTIPNWNSGTTERFWHSYVHDLAYDIDGSILIATGEENWGGDNDDLGQIYDHNLANGSTSLVFDFRSPGNTPGITRVNWPDSSYNYVVWGIDQDPNNPNRYWVSTGDFYHPDNHDQGRLFLWDRAANTMTHMLRTYDLQGSNSWQWGYITSAAIVPEIDADTVDGDPSVQGYNVEITTTTTGGMAGNPNFYSGLQGATLAMGDLRVAINNNGSTSVQAAAADGDEGDLTLSTALNYNNIGNNSGRNLTFAAASDININAAITDSSAGDGDSLNLDLEANVNDTNAAGSGRGAVTVGAAVDLNGGNFTAEGLTFVNNAAGTIDAGSVAMDFVDGVTIDGAITTNSFESEVRGSGTTTLNAALDAGTGTARFETVSGSGAIVTTAAGTITANKVRFDTDTGAVTVGGVIDTNDFRSEGGAFTNTAQIDAGTSAVKLTHTGDVTIGAPILGESLTVTSNNFAQNVAADYNGEYKVTATGTTTLGATVDASNVTLSSDGATTIGHAVNAAGTFSSTGASTFTSSAPIIATGDATLGHDGLMKLNAAFTANSLTTAGTGDFDSSGQTITVTGGAFTLGHSGTTTLGTVAGNTFTITGDQLLVGGTTNVQNLNIGGSTLTIGSGTNIQTAAIQQTGGQIVISGGRYQGPATSAVSLLSGTFAVAGNLDVAPGAAVETIFGINPTVGVGATLEVTGATVLSKKLTVNGGTLSTGSLSNSVQLDFQRGTVEITNSNLTVGPGGTFGTQMVLGANKTVRLTNPANTIIVAGGSSGGILTLNGGSLDAAGTITNNGTVRLLSSISQLGGAALVNNFSIEGTGRVMSATVNNAATGTIIAGADDNLFIGGALTNNGLVNFIEGSLEFDAQATNNTAGMIAGRAGIVRFADIAIVPGTATAGLRNRGTLKISGLGTTNVFGTIFQNESTGKIQITGGAAANFYGDVSNYDGGGAGKGEINVDGGSAATFFGVVRGSGDITGRGVKFFEGGLQPGQSPGQLNIEGDVVLGDQAILTIEIAGPAAGSQYDVLSVAGELSLGGTLAIHLLDGYVPALGSTFNILSATSIVGDFSDLSFNTALFASTFTDTGVTLTVIPEPATAALALGGLALLARRRRHH